MVRLSAILTGMLFMTFTLKAQEDVHPKSTDSLNYGMLDEVVVTGQFGPRSVKNSVYRVRTISQQQIQLRASTTVENILNTQLGIRFTNDMALAETDIKLMNMSGQNIKVLVDGIPMLDRGSIRQSLSQIDVNTIERIEIVEGPMSVTYGSDALAGVINIITKSGGQQNLQVSARIQEETAGDEYSFMQKRGTHNGNAAITWQNQHWRATASGTQNNFGGFQGTGEGRAKEWAPKDQLLLSGALGYRNTKAGTNYRLSYLDEDIAKRGPLNTSNYKALDQNYITKRYNHSLQSDWQFSDQLNLSASASYQDYRRRTRSILRDFRNGTSELADGAGQQDLVKFNSVFFRGTVQYQFSDKLQFQPGIEINSQQGNGQRISGEPRISDYAFFVSSEWNPLLWLHLRPGLRFTKNSVYNAPPVIPSLNAKINFSNNWAIRAAYARGFRAPALRELYFTFFDSNHSIEGNTDLKAEYSHSFNAYLSWEPLTGHSILVNSTLGGFFNRFENLITISGKPDDPSINTYANIDHFKTAGITWENKLVWKDLDATFGFSYISREDDLSNTLSDVPSLVWQPEVNANIFYQIPKWGLGINAFYKLNGKLYDYIIDGNNQLFKAATEAYHTMDLSVNKVLIKHLTLVGGVRNLFDVTRIRNTSPGTGDAHGGAPGATAISYGRSFFLGINVQWSK
ncbi:hypothetical protein GCM10011386_38120 [Parapedobacter defluvii]|uniref:Outer membrane receptor for ferrienterochelin and colicins n=1 Tax=Parapedobacter defluvii TaxID=2045106 RepID=A0ABQ1MPE2_9SPHI|nr:TonB-dependent receptor [Parapedobacter defluvii]GGC42323.1 hypothetical protein GCM10011386_38120 [Parapedobacter defluvii]